MSESKPENEEVTQLFSDFHFPTYEEWLDTTLQSLNGKPFDKLISNTIAGIPLQPMYRREDIAGRPHLHSLPGQFPYIRGTHPLGYRERPWLIAQEIPYGTPSQLNAALKHDMARGQTAVFLKFDPPTLSGLDPAQSTPDLVGHGGLSLTTVADVARLLAGIAIPQTPILMQSGTAVLPLTALILAYLEKEAIPTSALSGCAGADPLGTLAQTGSLPIPIEQAYDEIAELTRWTEEHAPIFQTTAVFVDGYRHAGGHAVQELAFALATGVAIMRALQARGLTIDSAAGNMRFVFAIGGNFFMEVAKCRAARMLWAQIVQAFGGSEAAQKMQMHTRSSRWNKTITDPTVNMLRVTTEAFAAAVGGSDSQYVAPFDEPYQSPDEFSRRIARNVQIILQEEVNLTKLIDPAGGSYYIEFLTDQVAQRAWALFQEIERQGGMLAALKAGFPQKLVAETAVLRSKNLAQRKDVLVGTNMYPNLNEETDANDKVDYQAIYNDRVAQVQQSTINNQPLTINHSSLESLIEAAKSGATLNQLRGTRQVPSFDTQSILPLPRRRAAEPFEALRAAADAYAAKHGHRPQIFMANIGSLANHKPRADFTAGFFKVGGFELVRTDGFAAVADAVQAAVRSGITAVVLCGTDADYPNFVPPFVQRLKAERPGAIAILAGYPKKYAETFKAAGVDQFIYQGADCYVLNQQLQAQLLTA